MEEICDRSPSSDVTVERPRSQFEHLGLLSWGLSRSGIRDQGSRIGDRGIGGRFGDSKRNRQRQERITRCASGSALWAEPPRTPRDSSASGPPRHAAGRKRQDFLIRISSRRTRQRIIALGFHSRLARGCVMQRASPPAGPPRSCSRDRRDPGLRYRRRCHGRPTFV